MLLTISICVTSLQSTGLVFIYVTEEEYYLNYELVQYLVVTNDLIALNANVVSMAMLTIDYTFYWQRFYP